MARDSQEAEVTTAEDAKDITNVQADGFTTAERGAATKTAKGPSNAPPDIKETTSTTATKSPAARSVPTPTEAARYTATITAGQEKDRGDSTRQAACTEDTAATVPASALREEKEDTVSEAPRNADAITGATTIPPETGSTDATKSAAPSPTVPKGKEKAVPEREATPIEEDTTASRRLPEEAVSAQRDTTPSETDITT